MAAPVREFDVVVIGGGPGGSMTAGLLAKAGRRTAVVEREDFPRFHIGESMLPQSLSVLDRAGALDRVRDVGFVRKDGAAFVSSDGTQSARFDFSEASPPTAHPFAYQVDRATFDAELLSWAVQQGAELVRRTEGADVRRRDGRRCASVTCGSEVLDARFVVDACGLDSTSGRLHGWQREPLIRDRVGIFGHFKLAHPAVDGVPDARPGDIVIVENPGAWAWFIPLRHGVTSVGFVLTVAEFATLAGATQEEKFGDMSQRMPAVRTRLEGAERLSPIRGVRAYGRSNGVLWDDGVVLVGDAAGFLDPVFSSGICLALSGAERAALTIGKALDDPAAERVHADAYESWVRKGFRSMTPFVEHWYDGTLKRVFFHPRPQLGVRRRITSVLAGELWRDDNPVLDDGSGWVRGIDRMISSDGGGPAR